MSHEVHLVSFILVYLSEQFWEDRIIKYNAISSKVQEARSTIVRIIFQLGLGFCLRFILVPVMNH